MKFTNYSLSANTDKDVILIDGKAMKESEFTSFLRRGLNHKVTLEDGTSYRFIVTERFGKWVVQPAAAAPCSLDSYYKIALEKLSKCGRATLEMDDFYVKE